MATVTIRQHERGGNKKKRHTVHSYIQRRKDAKPKRKKGYTKCQQMIAHVYSLNNPFNATRDQLRNDPLWRNYVCNCQSSSHWSWITGGGDGKINGPSATKDFKFQAPSFKSGQTHTVTIKGRIINVKGRILHSRCGVNIFQPAHQRALQGKSIAYLVSGA